MADDKPIIIIKKVGGHGGHHGGAWKIAYADLVTAMMAFFLVMWLVNSADSATKKSIASYFKNPGLFSQGSGTPLMTGQAGILPDSHTPPSHHREKGKDREPSLKPPQDLLNNEKFYPDLKKPGELDEGSTEKKLLNSARQQELRDLEQIADEINNELGQVSGIENLLGDYEIKLESDGLSIEIMDTALGSMFTGGSASITPAAQSAFYRIAEIIAKYPNRIDVIGHTDAKPFSKRPNGYSNWELSADRANAARRLLVQAGISEDRLISVVGRSDRDLRDQSNPLSPSNRRISLKLRFKDTPNVPVQKLNEELKRPDKIKKEKTAKKKEVVAKPAATPDPYADKYHLPWITHKRHNVPAEVKERETIKLDNDKKEDKTEDSQPKRDHIFSNNPVVGPLNPLGMP